MSNYSESIKANLCCFPGIANNPKIVSSINDDLNILARNGFQKLVDIFCQRTDPDQSRDFLFEIWICKMLLGSNVKNLTYEPPSHFPPDFSCDLNGVHFDIQVKRIHKVSNETDKVRFEREFKRRLLGNKNHWFINLRISEKFQRQHINAFFEYLNKNMASFVPRSDYSYAFKSDYFWELDNQKLVGFSFNIKNRLKNGISIGMIHSGNPGDELIQMIDDRPARIAMRRVLKKAKRTFARRAGITQCNLVVVQPDSQLWIDDYACAADILYGEDQAIVLRSIDGRETWRNARGPSGVLKDPNFCNITGVIFVPPSVSIMKKKFEGSYFLNPARFDEISHHPVLFPGMKCALMPEWKLVK